MLDIAEDLLDRTVSSHDGMVGGNLAHYFSVGRSALMNIQRALISNGQNPVAPARILDFPCGHGRVLRYLKAAFPQAEITACDLLREGVDFCASQFGAIPVYSDPDPSLIPLVPDTFDLIWVGSLFTHLDAERWLLFLPFFRDLLKPGGVLVFSTQGRQSHRFLAGRECVYGLDKRRRYEILRQYERTGFGYVDYPDQVGYGISLAEPHWVCRLVTSLRELRLASVGEKSWDHHQDVYGCVRDPDWQVHCTPAPGFLSTSEQNHLRGSTGKGRARWQLWRKRSA